MMFLINCTERNFHTTTCSIWMLAFHCCPILKNPLCYTQTQQRLWVSMPQQAKPGLCRCPCWRPCFGIWWCARCNQKVDEETATAVNQLFFEIIAAPDYEINALQLLRSKKNRVILRLRDFDFPDKQFKSVLNGILQQDRDRKTETVSDLKLVTSKSRMLTNTTTWCLPTSWQSIRAQMPLYWPKTSNWSVLE